MHESELSADQVQEESKAAEEAVAMKRWSEPLRRQFLTLKSQGFTFLVELLGNQPHRVAMKRVNPIDDSVEIVRLDDEGMEHKDVDEQPKKRAA